MSRRRWGGVLLGGFVFLAPLLPGRGFSPLRVARAGNSWFVVAKDSSARYLLKVDSGKIVKKVKLPLCCVLSLQASGESLLVLTPWWAQAFLFDTSLRLVDSVCLKTGCDCKSNAVLDPQIFLTEEGNFLCVGRYHVGEGRYAMAHLWDRKGNFVRPLVLFDSTWGTEEVAKAITNGRRRGDTLLVWNWNQPVVHLLSLRDGSLFKSITLRIPPWATLLQAYPLSKGVLVKYARREKAGNRFTYALKRWALFSYSGKLVEEGEGWFPTVFALLPGDTLVVERGGELWLARWE